ncbi:MAG: ATP-binding cassette domain-containing protein [Ahrensia sp.]|nr:ATP-binding cassette domain-containing protein [Ahrensia sp.]
MSAVAQIDDVSFAHPGSELRALQRLSFRVAAGETVAVLGPSGAGKTTLLTLLDGRLHGWRGLVSVLDAPLDPDQPQPRARRADTGFIFQEFALVERSTVLRNVINGRLGRMPPLRAFLGNSSPRDLKIARDALIDCGIADLAERRVDSLSGGQRQRVAIARCLAQEPLLILADEPVSNLDPARAAEILALLTGAARSRNATVLFSSHQPELACRFAERVVGMRDGRIVFDAPAANLTNDTTAELYRETAPFSRPSLRAVG